MSTINDTKKWYLSAKYGIYMTLSYEGYDRNPLPRRYLDTCGVFSDGRMPTDINEIANAFDVDYFCDFCHKIGVQYVNFTLYHAHMYMLCPNEALDKWLPGHTSKRDVIRELLNGLHKYGIKLQLYIHSTVGDSATDEEREATGYNDSTNHFLKWNNFINDVFDCLTKKYGNDMDSYYIDMIFDWPFVTMIDIPRLRALFDRNCPNAVITGNGEANDLVDFSSREDCSIYIESEYDRYSTAVQHVILLPNHKGKGWWSTVPKDSPCVVDYSPEHLYRALVLNCGSNTGGGGVAFGFGPYCDKGFEPGIEDAMLGLWKLISPVKNSILNTVPSKSWVTPSGYKIGDLFNGMIAVTSDNGKYEFLHFLTHGKSKKIELPVPLDGKTFGKAVNLRTNNNINYVQTKNGLVFEEIEWDNLDTVIRLDIISNNPQEYSFKCIIDKNDFKIFSPDSADEHPVSFVNDGFDGTYWESKSGNLHSIYIKLNDFKTICGILLTPPNIKTPEMFCKHIAICSVFASNDGVTWRAVATSELKRSYNTKTVEFSPIFCKYLKIQFGPDWFLTYEHKVDILSSVNIEECK